MDGDLILIIVVASALAFDFTNGFHDTANAVATSVSTYALSPRVAVLLASILNFVGAFISLQVAATVGSGIVESGAATTTVVFAGLVGAISWNLITWWFGLPSSSSHALIGGLVGATLAAAGTSGVDFQGLLDNPALAELMASLSDEEIRSIKRGGQDPLKIWAAYAQAMRPNGRPTVILAKTVKGDGMGPGGEGRNTAHQKKQLSADERRDCARRWGIPLADADIVRAAFYRPAADSPELRYLHARRERLGGYLPARRVDCPPLPAPAAATLAESFEASGERALSTTTAAVRLLGRLLRDPALGRLIVPIVPDEARTFGMEGLFRSAGIYSPEGQRYVPVDGDTLLPYREARDGQIGRAHV